MSLAELERSRELTDAAALEAAAMQARHPRCAVVVVLASSDPHAPEATGTASTIALAALPAFLRILADSIELATTPGARA